jgi:ABC-type glycerol-3-phosphate transport system substrate-binding protein
MKSLFAVALFCLSACGQSDHAADRLDGVDPQGQKVEFWYQYDGVRGEALLELIGKYNAANSHGIEVTGKHAGRHAEVYNKMLQGIHGAPLPQLVVAYQNQAQIYHQADVVVDLTPYMESAKWGLSAEERADYFGAFLEQDNVDGVQTAFLPNRSMEILYYNEDWLGELGQTEPPRNWMQFEQLCRKAAQQPFSGAGGEGGQSRGFYLGRDASRLAAMIFSRGGDLLNETSTAYTFDTEPTRASLSMLRSLIADDAVAIEKNSADTRSAFGQGQVLFVMHSSSHLPQIAAAVEDGAGFTWNVAPVPYEGETPIQNVYGASLAVAKSTPEQQLAAWLFIKWFTEPDQQDRWVSASNYFPVRRSVVARLGSYYRTAYQLLEYGKPEPGIGGYEPVRGLMVNAMMGIVEGADMTTVLGHLEDAANRTIQAFE